MTHFRILTPDMQHLCSVVLLKMDEIEVKRRPSHVFRFKDPERFLDAVASTSQVIIYVGKVKNEDGSEVWKAMHWNPSDPKKDKEYMSKESMLPLGSVAWLDLESEFGLDFDLKQRQTAAVERTKAYKEMEKWVRAVREIDRHNTVGEQEYEYMSTEELHEAIDDLKAEYQRLSKGGPGED